MVCIVSTIVNLASNKMVKGNGLRNMHCKSQCKEALGWAADAAVIVCREMDHFQVVIGLTAYDGCKVILDRITPQTW